MPKPVKLLSPPEVLALVASLEFDELVDLNERTSAARGDAAYIVTVSEWKNERSRTHEHSRRKQSQTAAAGSARRKTK